MTKSLHILAAGLVLGLYTGTVFGCPYKKLVDAGIARKAEKNSRQTTDDLIKDPIPPRWAATADERNASIAEWEAKVLDEAEKRWREMGVNFERVDYNKGYALKVKEEGDSPLNLIRATAGRISKSTDHRFEIYFSPRSLVRRWPDENLFFLVGGSFSGKNRAIHLPFSSLHRKDLSATVHHEFLHSVFDYYRQHDIDSAFHGSFHSRDGEKPMWKGTHYTNYMSLEELAAFPVNLRLYEIELHEIESARNSAERSQLAKHFVNSAFSHALSNAVNARHARNFLGKVLRDLDGNRGQVEMGNEDGTVEFEWANIRYSMRLPKKGSVRDRIALQHEMASKASEAGDALIETFAKFQERPEGTPFTDADLAEISRLLKATRRATVPYIKLN